MPSLVDDLTERIFSYFLDLSTEEAKQVDKRTLGRILNILKGMIETAHNKDKLLAAEKIEEFRLRMGLKMLKVIMHIPSINQKSFHLFKNVSKD